MEGPLIGALARYLSFHGRATRLTYWRIAFLGGLLMVVPVVMGMLLAALVGQAGGLIVIVGLPILVACVAVGVRRLHDRGKSGWWLLLYWPVPMALSAWVEAQTDGSDPVVLFASAASFALQVWALTDLGFLLGTPGPNRFGPDPSQPEPVEVFG